MSLFAPRTVLSLITKSEDVDEEVVEEDEVAEDDEVDEDVENGTMDSPFQMRINSSVGIL
jgi:hypothetical protein